MCGIIAYTGDRQAAQLLLDGLSKLEYRGYDSTGISVIDPKDGPTVHKSSGKLQVLLDILGNNLPSGTIGIGHTRWATHGKPTDFNAHPHTDCSTDVVVAHNGIVENYLEIKDELQRKGHKFASETDSEVLPHLIESFMAQGYTLEESMRNSAQRIRGAHAVVAASRHEPGKIVAFRLGNAGGIVVGYGKNEMLLASDIPALLNHTKTVAYLGAGETVSITNNQVTYSLLDGTPVEKTPSQVSYDSLSAAKGNYPHFMIKEIHEQPEAVVNTLRERISFDEFRTTLDDFPFSDEEVREFNKVVLIGMGTSLHAAMVGQTWIESLTRIPTEANNSSEYRYRNPIIDKRTLVISIAQSGETADTVSAMEMAKNLGARQITLCNIEGAQSTRIADGTMFIRAGLEVGVASSKTFVCSLTTLLVLAIYIAERRGTLSENHARELVTELSRLPNMLGSLLSNEQQYQTLARDYGNYSNFLFLGRGINHPLALEGALKLKEISYIHAEGYQAGEMKHGPISLIDKNMPIVGLIPQDDLYEKMFNNMSEAAARGGKVIAVASEGDSEVAGIAEHVIYIPATSPLINPIPMAVPMQLFAYEIAVHRGCEIDQPRNLAKSVTVE